MARKPKCKNKSKYAFYADSLDIIPLLANRKVVDVIADLQALVDKYGDTLFFDCDLEASGPYGFIGWMENQYLYVMNSKEAVKNEATKDSNDSLMSVECPACGEVFDIEFVGQTEVTCPACGDMFDLAIKVIK